MYCQGSTIRSSTEKIHQDDVIRCEFDGKAGTLTYSINGGEPVLGFSNITDEIYPACGSYRSGVEVKILKVEQFKIGKASDDVTYQSPLKSLVWKLPEEYMNRESNLLSYPVSNDDIPTSLCISSRGDCGASSGIHEWTYEILERSRSKYAIGVYFGNGQPSINSLLGEQIVEHGIDLEKKGCSFAWHTDGSLWYNGIECATNFGMSFLPLDRLSSVTIHFNFNELSLSYIVNGKKVGMAFGPEGSGAAVSIAPSVLSSNNPGLSLPKINEDYPVYPAATICSTTQRILLKTSGFYGSMTIPLELNLQKAVASVFGRLSASILKGTSVDQEEVSLLPWLQSPLFIGGLDSLDKTSELGFSALDADDENLVLDWEEEWSQKRSGLAPIPKNTDDVNDHKDERKRLLDDLARSNLDELATRFINWLEKIQPEPAFLVKAYKAGGYYSFPMCEMPYLVALLAHGGLENEAINVLDMMQKSIVNDEAEMDSVLPIPSSDMSKLWQRVNQLRQFLRKSRQEFKAQGSMPPHSPTSSALNNISNEIETNAALVPTDLNDPAPGHIINESNMQFYGENSVIYWKQQESETRSLWREYEDDDEFESYYCQIYETGIDCEECCIFVRYRMFLPEDETTEPPGDSTLNVNNGIKTTPELLLTDDGPNERGSMMRFDLDIADFDIVKETGEVEFCYGGNSEYTKVTLILETEIPDIVALSPQNSTGMPPTLTRARSSVVKKCPSGRKKKAVDFEDLCERVEERARFLLSFSSVGSATPDDPESKKKASLYTLLDKYSQDSFALPKLRRLRSQDGQERWKKIIEFLRVHSNIRKQASQHSVAEDSDPSFPLVVPPDSTNMATFSSDWEERTKSSSKGLGGGSSPIRNTKRNGSKGKARFQGPLEAAIEGGDDFSENAPAQAAMQACGLFLTIDDSIASPFNLSRLIRLRAKRAKQRAYALQALQSALQLPEIVSDSFCVDEILLFVRAAMQSPRGKRKESTDDFSEMSSHYLVNLEGCPAPTLAVVQSSFLSFYSVLSDVIGQYISAWSDGASTMCRSMEDSDMKRPDLGRLGSLDVNRVTSEEHPHLTLNSIKMMMRLWVLNYSNRDHRFVMKSGVIPSLYKLLSLAFYEKVAQIGLTASRELSNHILEFDHKFPESRQWKPWNADEVGVGLHDGKLSCRNTLLHLQLIPDKIIDTEKRFLLGLTEPIDILRSKNGISEVSLLHNKISSLIEKNRAIEEEAALEKEAKNAEEEEKKDEEITKRIHNCAVFDSVKKSSALKLTKNSLVCTCPRGRRNNSSSAYLDVLYDLDLEPDVSDSSGNYFEIHVKKIGMGDFSIGLVSDSLDSGILNKIVGLEDGTYGIRADTGAKQGSNSTGDNFRVIEEGDIVGCGIDFSSKEIWYTCNGELLGVAFTEIAETKLRPVVSFSSRNEDAQTLQVNCGIEAFKYEGLSPGGSAVVPNSNAAAEREFRRHCDTLKDETLGEIDEKLANLDSKELEVSVNSELWKEEEISYAEQVRSMYKRVNASAAYEDELLSLRSFSSALMRFILAVTCHSDSDYDHSAPVALDSEIPSQLVTPLLMRGVSSYGTPKFVTREDGIMLQEGVTAAMMQQLILGATYLSNSHSSSAVTVLKVKTALPMNQTPPMETAHTITATQAIQLEQGNSESDPAQSQSDRSDGDRIDTPVLEVVEVESIIHKHLVTLAAIMASTRSLKKEVSKVKSIAALLQLLQYGSNRIKNTASAILQKILPDMVPEEVEMSLSEELKAQITLVTEAQVHANHRRQRRMPDGLIRSLLFNIRDAISVGHMQRNTDNSSSDKLLTNSPHQLPHGTGQQLLLQADQHISLIQGLFEAPMWTELIACNITDCLRNATIVLASIDETPSKIDLTHDEEDILFTACAASGVLCGLGIIKPGVEVVSNSSKDRGTFISASAHIDKAKVIFEKAGTPAPAMKSIELVKFSSLNVIWNGTNVDMTRLSQPLLPQLIALLKALLRRKSCDSDLMGHMGACISRLNYFVSTAVSVLLEKQPDIIIDATQDEGIIVDIMNIALQPTGMKQFSSLLEMNRMWCHTQGRAIERENYPPPNQTKDETPASKKKSAEASLSDQTTIANVSKSAVVDVEQAEGESKLISHAVVSDESLGQSILLHDEESRSERLETARLLSAETGVHVTTCLQHFEFYMADTELTRQSLLSMIAQNGSASEEPVTEWIEPILSASTAMPRSLDVESESKTEERERQKLIEIVDQASNDEGLDKNVFSSVALLDAACYDMDIAKIGEKGRVNSDVSITESSYVLDFFGGGSATGEGPIPREDAFYSVGTRCQLESQNSLTDEKKLLLNFYDSTMGFDMYNGIDIDEARVVRKFFDQSVDSPAQETMNSLDQACSILRMRKIAARLMLENSLNLVQGTVKVDDWLNLLKLATTTDVEITVESSRSPDKIQKVFETMCGSLLSRAYSSASDVVISDHQASVIGINDTTSGDKGLPVPPIPGPLLLAPLSLPTNDVFESSSLLLNPPNSKEDEVVLALIDDLERNFTLLSTDLDVLSALSNSKDTDPRKFRANSLSGAQSARSIRSRSGSKTSRCGVDEIDENLIFSSPHPFTAPCKTAGKINLPSSWCGAIITFHPKCRTPSPLAALKLYVSENDFVNDIPKYTFGGGHNSTDGTVFPRALIISDLLCFYYRFECILGADKPLIAMVSSENSNLSEKDGKLFFLSSHAPDNGPVGLGEDGSLANLFEVQTSEPDEPENSVSLCDIIPLRTGTWYFEVEISSVLQKDKMNSSDMEAAVSTVDQARIGLFITDESVKDDQTPSILGNDDHSLAYSALGFVCHNGHLFGGYEDECDYSWGIGDIIGCFFTIDSENGRCVAAFSKNGIWLPSVEQQLNVSGANGNCCHVRPAFSMSTSSTVLQTNFGEKVFKHSSSIDDLRSANKSLYKEDSWMPVLSRAMTAAEKHEAGLDLKENASESSFDVDLNSWGYQFIVRPLKDLHMTITRNYELVAKLPAPKLTDGKSADPNCMKGLWIWRPSAKETPGQIPNQRSVGDIATPDSRQPRGSVMVDKGQCLIPTDFIKIGEYATEGIYIYRPHHDKEDYVAMGDIVTKSSTPPTASSLGAQCPVLVPKWAVTETSLGHKIFDSKRIGSSDSSKISIWSSRNGLQTFFGSPTCDQFDPKAVSDESPFCFGVGTSYSFNANIFNAMNGEWSTEEDALELPSASWANEVLDFLLSHPETQEKVLKPSTFSIVVDYIQSAHAPAPLSAVSSLIKMIRGAQEKDLYLPLAKIDGLCKVILQRATSQNSNSSTSQLSDAMLVLLDLVVEVQSAKVSKNTRVEFKDWVIKHQNIVDIAYLDSPKLKSLKAKYSTSFNTYIEIVRSSLACQKNDLDIDEVAHMPIIQKEIHNDINIWHSVSAECTLPMKTFYNWWQHHIFSDEQVEGQFLCKAERLPDIFAKDNVAKKLKMVLGFLAALGAGVDSSQKDTELLLFGEEFKPSFPKILMSRVWHEFVSVNAFMESEHPYIVPGGADLDQYNPNKESAIKKYSMNRKNIPSAGHSVLKHNSKKSDRVGCIQWDEFPGDCIEIIEEKGEFVKLAPSMYEKLKTLRNFKEHNFLTEGWLQARSGQETYLEPVEYEIQRCVSFPGSKSIKVCLDKRISLGEGVLVFQTPTQSITVDSFALGDHTKAAVQAVEKNLVFTGYSELTMSFRMNSSLVRKKDEIDDNLKQSEDEKEGNEIVYEHKAPSNDNGHWGWAFTVVASKECFDSAEVSIDVEKGSIVSLESKSSEFKLTPKERDELIQNLALDLQVVSKESSDSKKDTKEEKSEGAKICGDSAIKVGKIGQIDPVLMSAELNVPLITDLKTNVEDSSVFTFRAGESNVKPMPSREEANARIQSLATQLGAQYRVGTLAVPYADNAEITIERPKFEKENCVCSVIIFLELPGVDEVKTISYSEMNSPAPEMIYVKGNTVKYHVLIVGYKDPTEAENGGKIDKAEKIEEESDIPAEMSRAQSTYSEHGDFWSCAACTLLNLNDLTNCSVCGYAAPGEISDAPSGGGVERAGWFCVACTFINPLDTNTCQICETRRELTEAEEAAAAAIALDTLQEPKEEATSQAQGETLKTTKDVVIMSMVGKLNEEGKFKAKVQAALSSNGVIRTPKDMKERLSMWTPSADNIILEYLNSISSEVEDSNFFKNPSNLVLPKKFLEYKYSAILKDFDLLDIQTRILLLHNFNKSLEELLPLINLRNKDIQSLGAMLRKCSKYVFLGTKSPILEKVIANTTSHSGSGLPASFLLNNVTAMSSRDNAEFEPSNSQCCFVQAFNQLKEKDSAIYKHLFAVDRVFQINFVGESGIDAGGVFREGISSMCQDLFSDHFNLFILCPNGQHETHMNCEKFVPNPAHTTPLALQMYEFVGKLMACSLRAKLMLPFEFPSIIWKLICGEELNLADLNAHDAISCQLLEALRKCDEDGIKNQEMFSAKYSDTLRWTYNGSDGVERELAKGSNSRVVTYENKNEFCDLMEKARMGEFSEQVKAMRKGFEVVLPERIIQLFSWDQLEVLVAGNPVIDMAMWKQQSSSSGLSTKLVSMFWKVMESLTNKEQSSFIRFAWGRSRLPPLKEFTTKMRLTSGAGRLPVAHTCFFSVELPDYETEEEMRHGLLTAIHFGVGGVLVS